jgi:CHAT domain-containing protein
LARALDCQLRANGINERLIAYNLTVGSEAEKQSYLSTLIDLADRSMSLCFLHAPRDPRARDLAATTILTRKGHLLDFLTDELSALRQRATPQDQKLLDDWSKVSNELASVALAGPQKTSLEEHQQRVKELEAQKEKIEAEIGQHNAGFRTFSQSVTLATLQAVIPANMALLEFAKYRPFNPDKKGDPKVGDQTYDPPRYAVLLLRATGEPQPLDLGEAKPIDEALERLLQALREPENKQVKALAREVDTKIFGPLRHLLSDTDEILLAPDSLLNLLPFEALVAEQGQYRVEQYQFHYLTSARDLLRLQVPRDSQQPPLIIANPLFGEGRELLAAKGRTSPAKPTRAAKPPDLVAINRQRGTPSDKDLASLFFEPLSGTAEEARQLKALLPEAQVLTGLQATETALKQIKAPRILHVATHGFFLSETPKPQEPEKSGNEAVTKLDNPLLRSGLALAGANRRKRETRAGDDSILTAMEAASLNLWGTKLVVLSACETGVGEVKNGEGVYGLRRALVLAGSETQVMSLWKVDDFATRQWMTAYYKGLLQGQGRSAAVRQVQLRMLKNPLTAHPYYWASFIQSGEWANLAGKR